MAYINVDEVYILDNTGLQVDMATDIPFADAGFSDAQKAQARKNIAAGGSNRNLLDNAYFVGGGSQLGDGVFPINQRGQTSYSAYTNSIDRWYAAAAMTVAADGISCGAIVQKLSQVAPLDGKTLTFSALLADGTMLSGSAVFNSASDTYFHNDAGAGEYLLYNTYFGGFEVVTARKIAAVKLELGTVSTLANDVPPDFGEELRKCQRYFVRLLSANAAGYMGVAYATGGGASAQGIINLPVPLRTSPSISVSSCALISMATGSYAASISSASFHSLIGTCLGLNLSMSGTPSQGVYVIYGDPSCYIDISAEL